MKKGLILLSLLFFGTMGIAGAASFSFDGYITYQTDVVFFDFSLASDATNVSVWTDSFNSGDNFDPITALWASNGDLIAENDDNATISPGTQTYWDSGFFLPTLAAGNYLFTVASFSNFAAGTNLSDGFAYDGLTSIPIEEHWNEGTGYYNVNFDGVDSAGPVDPDPVPEPATLLLFGASIAGLALYRRKRMK